MKSKIELATLEEWKKLLTLSQEFNKLKPWQYLDENSIFAIKDPDSGEISYNMVLGILGEVFGIVSYLGDEGFYHIEQLKINNNINIYDPLINQKCLYLSFEDKKDVEVEMIELAKKVGIKFKSKKEYPMFRSFEPNYFPWYLNRKEVKFFTYILEQSIFVVEKIKNGENILKTKKKNNLPIRFFENSEWKNGEINKPEYHKPEIKPMIDLNLLDKSKKFSVKKGLVWEMELVVLPDPIMEEDDEKPYYPYILFLIDKKAKEPIENDTFKHNKVAKMVPQILLKSIKSSKVIPEKIHTENKELSILLKDICESLGIKLEVKKMSAVAESIKNMMFVSTLLEQMDIDSDEFD